ncbi:MAG: c-type cytochrome biogenesis protein CcmI [Rhizobiaceae bacterium]
MLFWLLIAVLTLLAVVLAFAGIWRSGIHASKSSVGVDKAMYRARISEIDADFELGRIDEDAREAAKAEQARSFLFIADKEGVNGSLTPGRVFFIIALSMIFVPAFSLVLYDFYGSPDVVNTSTEKELADAQPNLTDLLSAAERRLSEFPDDVRGWRVVAPVYMRLGRFEDATNAFRNLIRLEGETPKTLATLGEALVLRDGNQIQDEAFGIFKRLLGQQPENARFAYFVGLGEFQRGNSKAARAIWQSMLDGSKGDEPWVTVVRDHLSKMQPPSPVKNMSDEELEQINAMVSGLAERLASDPEDKPGWERLIRSYMVLERMDDAQSALNQAKQFYKGDVQFIAKLEKVITEFTGAEKSQ